MFIVVVQIVIGSSWVSSPICHFVNLSYRKVLELIFEGFNTINIWKITFSAFHKKSETNWQRVWRFCSMAVVSDVETVKKRTKNPSIYNTLRWVAWTMGQTNRRPRVWCSKYYFFILFIDLGHSKLFIFIFVIL